MFMDESEFLDEGESKSRSVSKESITDADAKQAPSGAGGHGPRHSGDIGDKGVLPSPGSVRKIKAPQGPPPSVLRSFSGDAKDGEDESGIGSAVSGSSSSRARILAQQRELQLKRRAEQLKGGVIRTSDTPGRPSFDPQHTPAVKQFSAPRVTSEDPYSSFGSPRVPPPRSDEVSDKDKEPREVPSQTSTPSSTRPTSRQADDRNPDKDGDDTVASGGRRPASSESKDDTGAGGPPRRSYRDSGGHGPDDRDRDYRDREYVPRKDSREREDHGEDGPDHRDYDRSRFARSGSRRGPDGDGYMRPTGSYRSRDGPPDDEHGPRGDRERGPPSRDFPPDDRRPMPGRGNYGDRDRRYDDRDRPAPRRYDDRDDYQERDYQDGYDRDYDRRRPYHRGDEEYEERDRERGDRDGYYRGNRPPSNRGPGPVDRARPPPNRRREDEDEYNRSPMGPDRRGELSPDRKMPSPTSPQKGPRADVPAPAKSDSGGTEDEEEEESENEDKPDLARAVPKPSVTSNEEKNVVAPNLDFLDLTTFASYQKFITNPTPKRAGVVQCYIKRKKSGVGKLHPEYFLYMKQGDKFLLAGKRRPNNKTSNYLITMSESDFNRDSNKYVGKLRANFVGTEFQVFDNGINPKDDDGSKGNNKVREELAVVLYASNVLGSRGPRKMQVSVPRVNPADDSIVDWRDSKDRLRDDELLEKARKQDFGKEFSKMHYFINKPPRWNDQVGAYVLNFNGRVTMASVKNFQLVDPDDQETIVLQFGRVGKDDFTMDFQWPMSPLQAFAVTLSSFDSKIACD